MKHLLLASAAAATIALASAPAQASTLVDTGAPANSGGYAVTTTQNLAALVTFTNNVTLSSIQSYFVRATGVKYTISLFGTQPGETLPTNVRPPIFSSSFIGAAGNGLQGLAGLNWHVNSGNYWVAFSSDDTTSVTGLINGVPHPLSGYAYNGGNNSSWNSFPLNTGLNIQGTAFGGVPEPMSWALMILGFGVIGSAMRRRKTSLRVTYA